MADSLLKKILLQADIPNTKPEDFKDLNALLKSDSGGGLFSFFALDGGFGSVYKVLFPCFVFNEHSVITAIDEEKIDGIAQTLLAKNDGKSIYRAGLCWALIAVYGTNIHRRLNAYHVLETLFDNSGKLEDYELRNRCTWFHNPILGDGEFFLLSKMLWSWEVIGTAKVLSFEAERQTRISYPITVKDACYLLGVKADNLDEATIDAAHRIARERLKAISGLKALDINNNRLFQNLKTAQDYLLSFVRFKQFNAKQVFNSLTQLIKKTKAASRFESALFSDVYKKFKVLDQEITEIAKFAKAGSPPYVTSEMIYARLGSLFHSFEVERDLWAQAKAYWELIGVKINLLLSEADRVLSTIDSTTVLCEKIQEAIGVLTEIEGSALEETHVLSTVAKDAADKNRALKTRLGVLQNGIRQYEEQIKTNVQNIASLSLGFVKETIDVSAVADANLFIREKREVIRQINERLVWLNGLDQNAKERVEQALKQYVVSQVDLDAVVKAIHLELVKIERPVLDGALTALLGRQKYLPSQPLELTVMQYLRSKKGDNLEALANSFIGEIKGLIQDQHGIKVTISLKEVFEPNYLSIDSAKQILNSGKTKLNDTINVVAANLNTELRQYIAPIMEQYEVLKRDVDHILLDKNNLQSSWQHTMAAFLQKQQLLKAKLRTLSRKIPADYSKVAYLTADVVKLIDQVRNNKLAFDGIVSDMRTHLGKSSLDVLDFLVLKDRINKARKAYEAQGKHHEERQESLERLALAVDALCDNNAGNRFGQLVAVLRREQTATAESHKRIGFLGAHRPSRLQKMYASLLEESAEFAKFSSSARVWEKSTPSPDTLKYMRLKVRIQREGVSYLDVGTHHADRLASLKRLDNKIIELDKEEGKKGDRFATLLAALRDEEKATTQSHLKIGFFPSWHSCRLQKVYGKILAEATKFEAIPAPTL